MEIEHARNSRCLKCKETGFSLVSWRQTPAPQFSCGRSVWLRVNILLRIIKVVRFSLYFFFFPLLFSCSSSSIGSNNGGYSTVPCHPKGWFGTSLFFCLIFGITYPTLQLAKGISNMASFFSILLCLSLLKLLPMKRDGELHVTSNEAIFIVSICFIMCKHSLPFWLNILLRQFQFWNSFSPVNDVWLPLKHNKW